MNNDAENINIDTNINDNNNDSPLIQMLELKLILSLNVGNPSNMTRNLPSNVAANFTFSVSVPYL